MTKDDNPFKEFRDSLDGNAEDLRRWCDLYDRYTRGEDPGLHDPKVAAAVAEIALIFLNPHAVSRLGMDGMIELFRRVNPRWNGVVGLDVPPEDRAMVNLFDMYCQRQENGRHPYAGRLIGQTLSNLGEAQRYELEGQLNSLFCMHQHLGNPYDKNLGEKMSLYGVEITLTDRESSAEHPDSNPQIIDVGAVPELIIDKVKGEISCGDSGPIEVSGSDTIHVLDLLKHEYPNRLTTEAIGQQVWGAKGKDANVHQCIAEARKALRKANNIWGIVQRRNFGYKLNPKPTKS